MNLTIIAECRCAIDAHGTLFTNYGAEPYAFWARYLDAFDHVTLAARVSPGSVAGREVTGPGVSVHAIPDYVGPGQYVRQLPAVRRAIRDACTADSAFILRVPGRLGSLAGRELRRAGRPYAVEVIGDPTDVFAPGSVRHPLRPIFRRVFTADLRDLSWQAAAAAYVTEAALQQRYPCPKYMVGVSDVHIASAALAADWKRPQPGQHAFRIVMVGTMAQLYKRPDVLLDALARVIHRGIDASAVLVGDGRFRAALELQAEHLGLRDRVVFRGSLPTGEAVRAELDAADLFVLPSRAEGLPRALIEAMARGLPCLASRVGGIPELLAEEDLLPPGDSVAVAEQIIAALTQPERRARMAQRNLERARDFTEAKLIDRRRAFYRAVLSAYTPAAVR